DLDRHGRKHAGKSPGDMPVRMAEPDRGGEAGALSRGADGIHGQQILARVVAACDSGEAAPGFSVVGSPRRPYDAKGPGSRAAGRRLQFAAEDDLSAPEHDRRGNEHDGSPARPYRDLQAAPDARERRRRVALDDDGADRKLATPLGDDAVDELQGTLKSDR